MDFKQLQYIMTIYEEGGINKAAEKLYISQPSLSKCVITLEKQLGMKIFDRSVVPIELTSFGKAYIDTAQQILNLNDDLIRRISDIKKQDSGYLRIGTTFSGSSQRLPGILPIFLRKYPDIEVEIIEEKTALLEESLLKGQLDLILVNSPMTEEGIKFMPLVKEKLYLAAPSGKFDLGTKEKTFENLLDKYDLNSEKFIVLHDGQVLRRLADNIFSDYNIDPDIRFGIRNINGAVKLSVENLGLTIVNEGAKECFDYHKEPDYYLLPEKYDIHWGIGYKKNGYMCEAGKMFLKVIEELKDNFGSSI